MHEHATTRRRQPKRPKIERSCDWCGRRYLISPSELERRGGNGFCSRTCWKAAPRLKPTRGPHNSRPVAERFWGYVDASGGPDACWPWTANARTDKGYGLFSVKSGDGWGQVGAHRMALILHQGRDPLDAITEPLQACHTCDNPPCCNPSHLFWGTSQDNHDDMIAKGRAPTPDQTRRQGSLNGNAKITESDVLNIWQRIYDGDSDTKIATDYGVSAALIWNIRTGKSWTHVR